MQAAQLLHQHRMVSGFLSNRVAPWDVARK